MDLTLSDGTRLRYHETGHGAPVLLIHGTAARLWGESVDALSATHRVIAYDRRSYGDSAHAPLANTTLHARDAAEVLEHVAREPALVVGWSMGGVMALELIERPELVRGLVLIEPPFGARNAPSRHMLIGVLSGLLLGKLGWPRQGATQFLRGVMRHRDGSSGFDQLPEDARRAILANASAITSEIRAGTGEHLTAEHIATIAAPIEVLLGTRSDRCFEVAANHLQSMLPQTRVHRVDNADHCLQLDAPAAVASAVSRMHATTTDATALPRGA